VLRFDHLCYGQWHSMVNLSPRLPVKQQTSVVIETTETLREKTIERKNNIKMSERRNRLVTEKPDFEIIDEDYLL
jgi:hypothetical protein